MRSILFVIVCLFGGFIASCASKEKMLINPPESQKPDSMQNSIRVEGSVWLIEAFDPPPTLLPDQVLASILVLSERDTAFFDLDNDEFGKSSMDDLKFFMTQGSDLFLGLKPDNNSKYLSIGNVFPNFQICRENLDNFTDQFIGDLIKEGSHFCVLTSEGRLSGIQTLELKPINPKTLEIAIHISFITWQEVVSFQSDK